MNKVEDTTTKRKKRAMTTEQAQRVKKQGHTDEKEFARLIGMNDEYQNGGKDKKDVVDQNGDTHSIKGGEKKWQVFLYSIDRFQKDIVFKVMGGIGDGVGEILYSCLECFPEKYELYQEDKIKSKELLKSKMIALSGKLQNDDVFSAFLLKSMFNCGEVVYLTIKNDGFFHIFLCDDVIEILVSNLLRETSKARIKGQMDYQKVTFVCEGKNVGTIEIRHDGRKNYRKAVCSLDKAPILELLISSVTTKQQWGDRVIVYGKAIKKFEKNHKDYLSKKDE